MKFITGHKRLDADERKFGFQSLFRVNREYGEWKPGYLAKKVLINRRT